MRIKSTGTRGKKLRESKQKKKVMRGTNAARIKCREFLQRVEEGLLEM